jgi:hypothetical protein
MNTVILTILLISFLNNVSSITSICGARFKNNYLKLILLSDKRNIKIFKEIKNFYKICYNKSISCIGQGVSDYNNKLTEDEKTIVEAIISLYY